MYSRPSTSASISAGRRVEVRRHPGRALHAEPRVRGLGAVVAGADGDAAGVEHLRPRRAGARRRARRRSLPRARPRRSGPSTVSPGTVASALERVGGDRLLVRVHGVHADVAEVVHRGAEADRLDDRRGAGLELVRDGGVRRPLHRDGLDHLAAAEERRQLVEHLAPAPEHADAGRADALVAGEGEQVGAARRPRRPAAAARPARRRRRPARRPRGPAPRSRRPG